jgi:hypothetical protein
MPQKTWVVGEEVLAADFNSYVQQQVVPQFPNTATRDSEWTAPPDGALCVTTDTYTTWMRQAGAWAGAGTRILGFASGGASQSIGTGLSNIGGCTLTITALANHKYLAMLQGTVNNAGAAIITQTFIADGGSTLLQGAAITVAAGYGYHSLWLYQTGITGSYTFKGMAQAGSGSFTLSGNFQLLVVDLGV